MDPRIKQITRPAPAPALVPLALAAVALTALAGSPAAAQPGCQDRMSRMPMTPAASPPSPGFRANMLRVAPNAGPTKPARRKAVNASAGVKRKARPVRTSAHRPIHRKSVRHVARAPTPPAVPPRAPTPMQTAAAELATPQSYALISATICETGPAADVGQSPPTLALGSPALPPGEPEGPVLPPLLPLEPGLGPDEPGLFPPGPPFQPPAGPPVIGPPVTPVPEPASWLLMITGFGLLGARLRRSISSGASGCRGRAGRPE